MNKIDLTRFNEGDILMIPTSYSTKLGVIIEGQLRQIKRNGELGTRIIRKGHGATKLNIEFSRFSKESQWVNVEVGQYWVECKLFDVGGSGVNGGRTALFHMKCNGEDVVCFDRGSWGLRPSKEHRLAFAAMVYFLEVSPTRFLKDSPEIEDIKPKVEDYLTPIDYLANTLRAQKETPDENGYVCLIRWSMVDTSTKNKLRLEAEEFHIQWKGAQGWFGNQGELKVMNVLANIAYALAVEQTTHWSNVNSEDKRMYLKQATEKFQEWREEELKMSEERGF